MTSHHCTCDDWPMCTCPLDPLDHTTRANGHEMNCFCDVCDLSGTIGFTTCTCKECDPQRLVDEILNRDDWNQTMQEQMEAWGDDGSDASQWHDLLPHLNDGTALIPRTLYTPPKETSRVIHSHTLRDDIVEIREESVDALCIYSVSRISRADGFTGEITYCLNQKEANDVAERYIATDACPKIAKPDAPVAPRQTWDEIVAEAWCETYQSGQFDVPRQVLPSDGFTLDD